jgi:cell division control protein 45
VDTTQLYVMDSDDPDEAPPPDLSILEDMSDNSDSSDDSDSDTEDDDDDRSSDDEQARRQRRRTSESGDSEEVDPYDEEAYQAQRRRRHRRHKRQRKELQRQVNSYYSVTHFGATASSYMWELAAQLGHKSNELLWLNIVALTDYYVHERYTGNKYQEKVEALQNEVGRLNITQEDMLDDTVPEQDRIAFSEEFRFMLPRFWTLYDAMVHSSYVASRLEIWRCVHDMQALSHTL